MQRKNTSKLISPEEFKWKVLVVGFTGVGKTTWASGAPNPGFAACESGHGSGLVPIVDRAIDYVEPRSFEDLEAVCQGAVFPDKDTIVIDSLTAMARGLVKDKALTVSRRKGETEKRAMGVPELDDYGTMGELLRGILSALIAQPKHIVVTALYRPPMDADVANDIEARPGGPDLPGSMAFGAPAMFDSVLFLRTKKVQNPTTKAVTIQRYFSTVNDGTNIAKCRNSLGLKQLLDLEEIIIDPLNGKGSWQDLFDKILKKYTIFLESMKTNGARTASN